MIQRGSGNFEYITDEKIVLSGQISFLRQNNLVTESEKLVTTSKSIDDFQEDIILKDEVYEILENKGYKLGDSFKNITSYKVHKNNIRGFVKWKNDWIYFLEGLIKFSSLNDLDSVHTKAPVSIRQISVNPLVFKNINKKSTFSRRVMLWHIDYISKQIFDSERSEEHIVIKMMFFSSVKNFL